MQHRVQMHHAAGGVLFPGAWPGAGKSIDLRPASPFKTSLFVGFEREGLLDANHRDGAMPTLLQASQVARVGILAWSIDNMCVCACVYLLAHMSQPQNYQRPLYQRRFIQYCFLHFPWRTIGDSQKTIPLNMVCAGPSSWSCRSLTCVPCLY